MAFYSRTPSPDQPIRFHTALLLVPKTANKNKIDSKRYHAVNKVAVTEGGTAKMVWKYEAFETVARTRRLVALMLLGKIPRSLEAQVGDILSQVPVLQGDDWWCCNWIWSALQVRIMHDTSCGFD